MRIRTISSLREFDDLAGLWTSVTKHGEAPPSLLLTHEWFACCWRTAGANRARELWIVEDDAGPLAMIPLLRWKGRYRGLPARILQLMNPPDAPFVDFPVGRARGQVMALLLRTLRERDDWDVFLMPGLPEHSATWKTFVAAAADGPAWRVAERVAMPHVSLAGDRASLRAALDSLEPALNGNGSGEPVVEEHRELAPGSPLFEDFMVMIAERPRRSRSLPESTAPQVRRFFRELTPRASANGWLSLWALRVGGRVVATEYQLAADGHVHALRRDTDGPGTDPYSSHLSWSIMDALLERPGVQTYSWLGETDAADPLVRLASSRATLLVEVFSPQLYGNLLHQLETRIMPLARRLARRPASRSEERPCA